MSPTSEGSHGRLPGRRVTPEAALWGLDLGSSEGPRAGLGERKAEGTFRDKIWGILAKGGSLNLQRVQEGCWGVGRVD